MKSSPPTNRSASRSRASPPTARTIGCDARDAARRSDASAIELLPGMARELVDGEMDLYAAGLAGCACGFQAERAGAIDPGARRRRQGAFCVRSVTQVPQAARSLIIGRECVAFAKRSSVFTLGSRAPLSRPRYHRLGGAHFVGQLRLSQANTHTRRDEFARQVKFVPQGVVSRSNLRVRKHLFSVASKRLLIVRSP